MIRHILLSVMLFSTATAFSQERFFTKNGRVSFEAGTDLEDINAVNNGASSVFDTSTGQIECAVLIKGFEFKRALMQEHFNENYMESDKYPKAVFKGKVTNIDKVNFREDGTYALKIKGFLEIHGTKKEIETNGIMNIAGGAVKANTAFTVLISDYNISIPGLVKDKISKTANIRMECTYNALK